MKNPKENNKSAKRIEEVRQRPSALQRIARTFSSILSVLILCVIGAVAFQYFTNDTYMAYQVMPESAFVMSQVDMNIEDLHSELKGLDINLKALSELPEENESKNELSKILLSIKQLDKKIKILELAIMSDPTKATAIPLLRKDIENIKEIYNRDFERIKSEIDTMRNLNLWLFGILFTIALTTLGITISR